MNSSIFLALKNRDFRNLWYSQIISQIALNMLAFVLAVLVYDRTQSNTAVSMMMLTFGIPSIIFGILFGSVVDFYDKRRIMLFCNISRALVLVLFFIFSQSLVMIYIFAVFVSALTQLFVPAEGPSIPQLLKNHNVIHANSLFTISYYLSMIIGAVMAGPMLKIFGSTSIFLLIGSALVLSSFFTYRLPQIRGGIVEKNFLTSFENAIKPIFEVFTYIKKNTRIRRSLILLTLSQTLMATLIVLTPGFSDQILSIALEDASYIVMGPAALGIILGAYLVSLLAPKSLKGTLIFTGLISSGTVLILFFFLSVFFTGKPLLFAVPLILFLGVSNSFVNVPSSTILQQESDRTIRGRLYGVMTSTTGGMSLLPVVFSGVLADVVGISKTLLLLGMIITAITLFYFFRRRKLLYYIE